MERVCKQCKSKTLVYEPKHFIIVCITCGLVYDDNMFMKLKNVCCRITRNQRSAKRDIK